MNYRHRRRRRGTSYRHRKTLNKITAEKEYT
jgi:hypothetical protein